MLRFSQDFGDISSRHRKKVTIHRNGHTDDHKTLYVEPEWLFQDLLHAASVRLGCESTGQRMFNAHGVEIDDCLMVEDDDILFLSNGTEYQPPAASSQRTQTTTVGNWIIGKLLGRGGFGEVRVGEHQLTKEKVALKFLSKRDIMSVGAAERTTTEIQCLTTLHHPNIIHLIQHLETPTDVILVFELMEGGDLYKYLCKQPAHRLSENDARHLMHQVLAGVAHAHNQRICHRDLKLENILLKDDTLDVVKIADFGLSDFYRPGTTLRTSCGSLSYLAPEVFKGVASAGPPIDVWGLGVIMFTLLCGRLPFEGPDLIGTKRPRESMIRARILKCQYRVDDSVSLEAKDLIGRMLRLDPSERASIPEIFSHCWLRANALGSEYQSTSASSISAASTVLSGSSSSPRGQCRSPAGGDAIGEDRPQTPKLGMTSTGKAVDSVVPLPLLKNAGQGQQDSESEDRHLVPCDSDENVLSSDQSINDDTRSSGEERSQLLRKASSCGSEGEPLADLEAHVIKEPSSPTFKLQPLRRSSMVPTDSAFRARPQTAQELTSPSSRAYHRKTMAFTLEQTRTLKSDSSSSETDLHQRLLDETQKRRSASLPPKPMNATTTAATGQSERRRLRVNAFQNAGSSVFKRSQHLATSPPSSSSSPPPPPVRLTRAGSADVKQYFTRSRKGSA